MAIKINGTTIIDNSLNLANTASITFGDATAQTTASTGGGVGEKIYSRGQLLHTIDNPKDGTGDYFGSFAAISGDYAIVSAYYDDSIDVNSGEVYIFNVKTGKLVHTLRNPNPDGNASGDLFGISVDIDGNYAIVGAYQEDVDGSNSGKAYIFDVRTGGLIHQIANPNAYSTVTTDKFGRGVAISGNYAIVGADEEDDAGGTNSGKAYIFNVTTGALLHTLDNPNAYGTSADDEFGQTVGIDGNYAIVTAWYEDDAGGTQSGKAYIFDVTTGALVHTLDNPNAYGTSAGDNFGYSAAISGNYAIVGAWSEDNGGQAYIFNVTTGTLVHTLDNPNAYGSSSSDNFGASVAISGNYAIVGANFEDDIAGSSQGKAYLFDVTTGDLLHTFDNPNDDSVLSDPDYFGVSAGISGNHIVIGANFEDSGGLAASNSGKAYIFTVNDSYRMNGIKEIVFDNGLKLESSSKLFGTAHVGGELVHILDNPNAYGTSASDAFGFYTAIDGNYAIVSAYVEEDAGGTQSGKAYIFNVTTGKLLHTLDNPNAYGTSAGDRFAFSVDISGKYAIVGAFEEDDAGGIQSGKAYIFNVTTGALVHTLDNPNAYGTSEGDRFGYSVSISGNYAIVGASDEADAGGTYSGKAYIYDVTTGTLLHTLDNPNAYGTSATDYFGDKVAISGNYAIVGAYSEDDADGSPSGKAYIFDVVTGILIHTLDNPNAYSISLNDNFGRSLDISGNYAIVGAYAEDSPTFSGSGKAYIFDVTTGELLHTLDNPDPIPTYTNDQFGYAVSISGNYVVVSAHQEEDVNGSFQTGKAYIFDVTTGELLHTLEHSTVTNDYFGWSVAISGNYVISGAPFEDDSGGNDSGKAYIFSVTNQTYLDKLVNLIP